MCGTMSPFRYFLADVKPIVMREPLADFLGAFQHHNAMLEYSFEEVVKMAGHACPTVASAFVCCRKALGRLHEGEIPERGNVAVTVHAEADKEAFGVIGEIFAFITGARGPTGFKGLGPKFGRKDLLAFGEGDQDRRGSFTFSRVDNGRGVNARILPEHFPSIPGGENLETLMRKASRDGADHEDVHKFQDLWMERVKAIALEERNVENWLLLITPS